VRRPGPAVVGLVLALLPVLVTGQSLGDAARREKERRAVKRPPARVYGDQDLGSGSAEAAEDGKGKGDDPASGEAGAESRADSTGSTPAADDFSTSAADDAAVKARARTEESWRARAHPVREAYELAERRVKRLEAQVAELEREGRKQTFVYGVYGGAAADRARERLEQARRDLAVAGKAWEDFQDEARRAGVPPGWLR